MLLFIHDVADCGQPASSRSGYAQDVLCNPKSPFRTVLDTHKGLNYPDFGNNFLIYEIPLH